MTALPAVSELEAGDDRCWFAAHSERRYRRRPGPDGAIWIIRRRGRATCLRTLARPAIRYPDSDEALRALWFEGAWPDLDTKSRSTLITAARKAEGGTAVSNLTKQGGNL